LLTINSGQAAKNSVEATAFLHPVLIRVVFALTRVIRGFFSLLAAAL